MSEYNTGVDINAVCTYCGKLKMFCDCDSTAKATEVIRDRIIRIYPMGGQNG